MQVIKGGAPSLEVGEVSYHDVLFYRAGEPKTGNLRISSATCFQ